MTKRMLVAIIALIGAWHYPAARSVLAADLPDRLVVGQTELVLNGHGVRRKFRIGLYEAGLYLSEPSRDAAAIIAADEPMAIRLEVTSRFVSQARLLDSLNDGFHIATNGNTGPIRSEMEEFRRCFTDKISRGDVFDLVYDPARGVVVAKNGSEKGIVAGLAFKQALFGIWLTEEPVDEDLKRSLLAGRPANDAAARRR